MSGPAVSRAAIPSSVVALWKIASGPGRVGIGGVASSELVTGLEKASAGKNASAIRTHVWIARLMSALPVQCSGIRTPSSEEVSRRRLRGIETTPADGPRSTVPTNGSCRTRARCGISPSTTDCGNSVNDILEDADGDFWFATHHHGVYRFDGSDFVRYHQKQGLASNAIQCIYEDREGRLWCGGYMGLYRLEGNTFVSVTEDGPWR